MFHAVSIDKSDIDVGRISEAMVYFGQSTIVVDAGRLRRVIDAVGYDNLIRAIDNGFIRLEYEWFHTVIANQDERNLNLMAVHLHAWANSAIPFGSAWTEAVQHFLKWYGITRTNRLRAQALADRMTYRELGPRAAELTKKQLVDESFMTPLVRDIVSAVRADISFTRFKVASDGEAFQVDTDLDFSLLNSGGEPEITPSQLVGHLYAANKEIVISADGRTALWLNEPQEITLRRTISSLTERVYREKRQIQVFEEIVFDKATIADVMNSGSRTFSEFLDFLELEETQKFKKWLRQQKPEGTLITEYHKVIFSKNGAFETPGRKAGKMLAATALDVTAGALTGGLGGIAALAASAGASVGIGAVEAIVEAVGDRLLAGWKPDAWVQGPAADFLTNA